MKKLSHRFKILLILLQVVGMMGLTSTHYSNEVQAIDSCSTFGVGIEVGSFSGTYHVGDSNSIDFTLSRVQTNETYELVVGNSNGFVNYGSQEKDSDDLGFVSFSLTDPDEFFTYKPDGHYLFLVGPGIQFSCLLGSYTVPIPFKCGAITVSQTWPSVGVCYGGSNSCLKSEEPFTVTATLLNSKNQPVANENIIIKVGQNQDPGVTDIYGQHSVTLTGYNAGEKTVDIIYNATINTLLCSHTFDISLNCNDDECNSDPTYIYDPGYSGTDPYILCNQIDPTKQSEQHAECVACAGGYAPGDKEGVWTAIGCIRKAPAEIAQTLIRVGLMMGGGAALLTMLAAGFILSVSQGDPKRTEEAKDMITAAFIGLVFIIFSVTILQFIGFSILKIPGFGG